MILSKRQTHHLTYILITIVLSIIAFLKPAMADTVFSPSPQTEYAAGFIKDCEEQQWFLNELEAMLNKQAKSINTLNSKEDFANIFTLGLEDRGITGKIPKAIGELYNLKYIFLAKNEMNGEIPIELMSLNKLSNLDLSENNLSGTIPTQISTLTHLETLLLFSNQLTGEIPKCTFELENLRNLDLSNNDFSSALPSDLSQLSKNIKVLALADNRITGVLTDVFTDSFNEDFKINVLDLSNNAFVGDIDETLLNLSNSGVDVDLRGNYLAGPNILQLEKSDDNFIEESEKEQNALLMPQYVDGVINKKFYFDTVLKTYNPAASTIKRDVLKLPFSEYSFRFEPESDSKRVEIGVDDDGRFYILSKRAIAKRDSVHIKMSITQNGDRPYSVTDFYFYATGGGSTTASYVENMSKVATKTDEEEVEDELIPEGYTAAIKNTKYISGYPDGTFKPENKITREEFAQMIFTIEHDKDSSIKSVDSSKSKFPDVDGDRWSKVAINFMHDNGLMVGSPDGSFRPKDYLTRAEYAVVISKYKNLAVKKSTAFSDVSNHWAKQYIDTTYEAKYMSGYPNGTFRPDMQITRAEVVSSVNRVINVQVNRNNENAVNPFIDLDEQHWAYFDILEAAVRSNQ